MHSIETIDTQMAATIPDSTIKVVYRIQCMTEELTETWFLNGDNRQGQLTDTDNGIQHVRQGGEHDVVCLRAEISGHVRRQPLHYDVVRPVHTKVRDVNGPQGPMANELDPPCRAVWHLTQNTARPLEIPKTNLNILIIHSYLIRNW